MLEGEALRRALRGQPELELAGEKCCICGDEMETCVRALFGSQLTNEEHEIHRHYCEPCLIAAIVTGDIAKPLPGESNYIKPKGDVC